MTNHPPTQDEPHSRFAFDSGARAALLGLESGETFQFDSGFVAERLPDQGFTISFDRDGKLTPVALLNPDLTMRINSIRELKPDETLAAHGALYGSTVGMYIEPPLAFAGPVRGPKGADNDSIPARLSPRESFLPSPTPGKIIHIREAYGNEPMEISEIDLDDLEEGRT